MSKTLLDGLRAQCAKTLPYLAALVAVTVFSVTSVPSEPGSASQEQARTSTPLFSEPVELEGDIIPDYQVQAIGEPPPILHTFIARGHEGNIWEFSGTASGGTGQTTVNLGGDVDSAVGALAPVHPDGTFLVMIELDGTPNDDGMVGAVGYDQDGQVSNHLWDLVFQSNYQP